MNIIMKKAFLVATFLCLLFASMAAHAQQNLLFPDKRLLPVPQQVSFSDQHYVLDDEWSVNILNVAASDPALQSMISELKELFGIIIGTKQIKKGTAKNKSIQLKILAGAVNIGPTTDSNRTALEKQAYRLTLKQQIITITANAQQGLFYGVQTLLQCLQPLKGKTYF